MRNNKSCSLKLYFEIKNHTVFESVCLFFTEDCSTDSIDHSRYNLTGATKSVKYGNSLENIQCAQGYSYENSYVSDTFVFHNEFRCDKDGKFVSQFFWDETTDFCFGKIVCD